MTATEVGHRGNETVVGVPRHNVVFRMPECADRAVAHRRTFRISGMILRASLLIRGHGMIDAGLVGMRSLVMIASNDGQKDECNRHENERPQPQRWERVRAQRQSISNKARGSGQLDFTFAA